jgi:hypothetical protein
MVLESGGVHGNPVSLLTLQRSAQHQQPQGRIAGDVSDV